MSNKRRTIRNKIKNLVLKTVMYSAVTMIVLAACALDGAQDPLLPCIVLAVSSGWLVLFLCVNAQWIEKYFLKDMGQEKGEHMMKQRVFIDMDGVLCEYRPEAELEDYERAGYFRSLRPRRQTIEAVKYLMESKRADVFVLSALIPGTADQASQEKNDWLDEFLPQIDPAHRLFVLCGTNKADAVAGLSEKDVLCDDYSHNLREWVASGGKAIKILNEVNGVTGSFQAGPRLRLENREELYRAVASL